MRRASGWFDALLQAGIEPAPPAEVEALPAADWQQAILDSYQPQCIVPGALSAQPMQQAAMDGTAPSFRVIQSLCIGISDPIPSLQSTTLLACEPPVLCRHPGLSGNPCAAATACRGRQQRRRQPVGGAVLGAATRCRGDGVGRHGARAGFRHGGAPHHAAVPAVAVAAAPRAAGWLFSRSTCLLISAVYWACNRGV